MSRILVTAGLLFATFGQSNASNQTQQKQQKQQKDWQKYVKEYVPASYQHFENHNGADKDSADNGVASPGIDLLEAPPSSEKTQAKSSEASGGQSQGGDYQKYMKQYAGGSGSQGGDYQQYMKKYAGGSQGGSSGSYQQYMKKYAGGSQGGDYQQYMKKYAGGSQGGSQSQSGDYQQYMKKYAGGSQGGDYQQYMKKYAGGSSQGGDYQQYSDYQKYMKRDQKEQEDQVVRNAQDAKNKSQLDAWKAANKQNVQWYVPAEYQKKAVSHVQQQYSNRLAELNNETHSNAASADDTVQSIINLIEIPKDADAKKKKALELMQASEQSIKKAQDYGESLKRAAADNAAIENTAATPVNNVVSAFDSRAKQLDANIADLQSQVKSKQTNADFAQRMHQTAVEVRTIRADEIHALEKAHRESNDAARHAARGVESEIRGEARKVRSLSDHMARMDRSTQDNATKLQNRAEEAADMAENAGESLARRTQDHLETQISKAREAVRKNAQQRSDAMREVEGQFRELEAAKTRAAQAQTSNTASSKTARSSTFLASYADNASSASASLLVLGAAACTCLAFVIKHNRRTVETPTSMLG